MTKSAVNVLERVLNGDGYYTARWELPAKDPLFMADGGEFVASHFRAFRVYNEHPVLGITGRFEDRLTEREREWYDGYMKALDSACPGEPRLCLSLPTKKELKAYIKREREQSRTVHPYVMCELDGKKVGFNPQYLVDILTVFPKAFQIDVWHPFKPARVVCEQGEAWVLPCRVL